MPIKKEIIKEYKKINRIRLIIYLNRIMCAVYSRGFVVN